MNEGKLTDFHRMMTYERINNNHSYEAKLQTSYKEILLEMTKSYANYREHVSQLLASLESNNEHSISYSIHLFFELYEKIINEIEFKFFDLSIMEHDADDSIIDKIKPIFESSYSNTKQQRMSDDNFDLTNLSSKDKMEISAFIIRNIQENSKKLDWTRDMVDVTIIQLTLLRQLLVSLNNSELFYHVIGLFFDRMTSSEYYQAGRDVAEEVIISSFKDGTPELGFFNSFRLYSNNRSVHASFLYANLSMLCILQKKSPYSEKYVKEVIWQGLKFFRNISIYKLIKRIYHNVPKNLKFSTYEKHSLDHSYFSSLLKSMDPSLPSMLIDYLYQEREEIIAGGLNDALPWLITLYNLRRLYPDANYSQTGFGFFIDIFEMIVPAETIKKYKDIIESESVDLKKYLKESLVKLNETRNIADFVYDNESAIRISSRLIEYSTKNQDASSFIMAMMLKSDFSLLFMSKESEEIAPLVIPEINIEKIETLYDDTGKLVDSLHLNNNDSVNWLAFSEGKIYHLQLFNGVFSFYSLQDWKYNIFNELISNDFFVNLSFTDSVKDKSGIRLVSPEEYIEQEDEIIKKLSIAKLDIENNAESVNLVKDMKLSNYPHNLFLDKSGAFISKRLPVTNVISTEWLLQVNCAESLKKGYSKSIWIPIESGDSALNWLYSGIEDTLNENSFEIFQNVNLLTPLSSDINIVCSHGAKNISEVQVVFQESNPTYDLSKIIGEGKILIFFVCYSGSMKTEFFRNNVTSLVKRFIGQGYEAVVAPFWALDVTIPRYWLPEFLNSINAGFAISHAVYRANMKVYDKYPTPAAWACLHLYGNPNLKIK